MQINGISSLYSSYDLMGLSSVKNRQENRQENLIKKFDTNQDGVLDKSELTSMIQEFTQKTGGSIDVDELFAALDANGDGSIDKKELEELRNIMPPPPKKDKEDLMTKFDTNGDGTLDKTELTAMLQDFAEKTGNTLDADKVFAALDTNGDNSIDKDELKGLRGILPPPPDRASFGRGPSTGAQEASGLSLSELLAKTSTSGTSSDDNSTVKSLFQYVLSLYAGQMSTLGQNASQVSLLG